MVILRIPGGLDYSGLTGDDEPATPQGAFTSNANSGDLTIQHRITDNRMMHADSNLDIRQINESSIPYPQSLPNGIYFFKLIIKS